MDRPRLPRAVLAAGLAALAGCGSGSAELPPAAEPAESPALAVKPAGHVVAVGRHPEGVIFDPGSGLVAVGIRAPNQLVLYDPMRGRVSGRIPLAGAPRHLALDGPGRVLVPAEQIDELLEVMLPGGATTRVDVGEHPHDATAAGDYIFTADEFGNSVSVVRGGEVIKTLSAPEQPGGIGAVGEDAVAVVAVRERKLESYDAASLSSTGEADAGAGPTHIESLGDRAFVADTEGGAILTFSLSGGPELLATTPLRGSPYGLAVDPRRGILWVTLTARNELVGLKVSGDSLRRVASYPTVQQPDSVAVDPATGSLFVTGREAGVVEQIKP